MEAKLNKKNDPTSWSKEFNIFLSSSEARPTLQLSSEILEKVRLDLNPSSWKVLSKMSLIHFFIGSVIILFCPQFGITLFPGMGLMSLFMRFGEVACMVGCGAVFLGSSSLVAGLSLRPEEIKVIRKNKWLQLSILATLSAGVLICLGTKILATLWVAWILGSLGGGIASLELAWFLRSWAKKRSQVIY